MAPRYAREVGSGIWKHKHPRILWVFVFQIPLPTSPRPKAGSPSAPLRALPSAALALGSSPRLRFLSVTRRGGPK